MKKKNKIEFVYSFLFQVISFFPSIRGEKESEKEKKKETERMTMCSCTIV